MKTINLLFDTSHLLKQNTVPKGYVHVPTYRMDLKTQDNTVKFVSFMLSVEQMFRNMDMKAISHVAIKEQEEVPLYDTKDCMVKDDPLNNLEMFWNDIKQDDSQNEIHMVETVMKDAYVINDHAFHVSRTYSPITKVKSVWLYRRGSKNWREGENYFKKPINVLE